MGGGTFTVNIYNEFSKFWQNALENRKSFKFNPIAIHRPL